jgi:beta-galactosidase/beta-glucuronidase
VFVNGIDFGSFIQCYTPIDVAITRALRYGQENEILIKVGDRYWLPSAAAGGTDKEKEHYLPGIWDDVSLSFTNKLRINKILLLPNLAQSKLTAKIKAWDLNTAQRFYGEGMTDTALLQVKIFEPNSKKEVAVQTQQFELTKDRNTELVLEIPLSNAHAWSPEDPFLYTAEVSISYHGKPSDAIEKKFGMRDFERRGKFFYLNGKKYYLRGSNITLQRFFEDPDCGNLAWDSSWMKKMLIDIPKQLEWNTFRICVGIAPDFWYDLADQYGLLFQNEWLYWQNHGWDDEIKKEYTDWVWADGSHPSIAIWDAINENWDSYIGNVLIPELKKLDPTRIWDAGYMTSSSMQNDDMDEPHPYEGVSFSKQNPHDIYPLGNLNYKPGIIKQIEESSSAQLVNEYGWVWLWRNGTPSKLTVELYEEYLGKNSTVDERRNFQAYWLQLETEWLRSNRNVAGVLAFCYLTNNYGYTGDWFVDNIRDLKKGAVLYWFKHCFAPTNIFINLTDERYVKGLPGHKPNEYLNFTLTGVNDVAENKSGKLEVKLFNAKGEAVFSDTTRVSLPSSDRIEIPYAFRLPSEAGGYLLETFFTEQGKMEKRISRRYIKIGANDVNNFYDPPTGD